MSAFFIQLETCRSVRGRTLTPAPQFWSCSKAQGRRSTVRQRLAIEFSPQIVRVDTELRDSATGDFDVIRNYYQE